MTFSLKKSSFTYVLRWLGVQIEYVSDQVMKNDLDMLGYVMEFCKVDTKNYLLPQRRNRVYATADVGNGQNACEYEKNMQKTMEALSSGILIPVDTMMDPNLPEEPLTTERQKDYCKSLLSMLRKNVLASICSLMVALQAAEFPSTHMMR